MLASGQVLERAPKTAAGRRSVPVDPATVAALKAWRRQQAAERLEWGAAWQKSGFIFTREDGQPYHPGVITKAFYQARAAAGVPRIRLHDVRHTSATLALAAGVHSKVVQERLGHATIAQTMNTSSHVMASVHEDAAATIAAGEP